jgi:hypothetical protein
MRFGELSTWLQARRDERELRRSLDSGSDDLLELIDEASGFGRRA